MEKMKRRRAWMRIMAVMLALVTGITMMPLDTFAAAGKDSGDYLKGSEEAADEFMTDKAYLAESGHSHDNCGCSECYDHEDCNCDGCGDNDVCDCGECSSHENHGNLTGATVSRADDTSVESDDVTPDGAGTHTENCSFKNGEFLSGEIIVLDAEKKIFDTEYHNVKCFNSYCKQYFGKEAHRQVTKVQDVDWFLKRFRLPT